MRAPARASPALLRSTRVRARADELPGEPSIAGCRIAANQIMDLCGVYYPDRIGR